MISEASNKFETKNADRFRKIRKAAAAALKELSVFRSAGPITREALDAEAARIAKEMSRRTRGVRDCGNKITPNW